MMQRIEAMRDEINDQISEQHHSVEDNASQKGTAQKLTSYNNYTAQETPQFRPESRLYKDGSL